MREGPPNTSRAEKHKWRRLVENFFCDIKALRRIATHLSGPDEVMPIASA
jgi:hypothetical protein